MRDEDKTKEQLLTELRAVRARLGQADELRRRAEKGRRDSDEAHRTTVETTTDGLVTADEPEEEIRRAGALLAEAQRLAHLGSWERDLATGRVTWSEELYRIYGLNPAEVVPTYQTFLERVHPEDREFVMSANERALREGTAIEYTFRVVRPDGAVRVVHSRGQVACDAAGRAARIYGAVQDVTERKQTEEKLRRSESLLAEAQHLARLGSWSWDVVSDTLLWSDEHYRIFGLEPQEMVMTYDRFLSLIHPDDRATIRNQVERAFQDRQPFEDTYRVLRQDATVRVVHSRGQVVFDEGGKPVRLFGTAQDITERCRAEERLRESEERFHQLAENIDGYFWLNSLDDREMYYLSPGYEKITGRSCASLYQQPESWADIIHPEDRAYVLDVAQMPLLPEGRQAEYRILRPDGSVRWIRDRAFPVRNASGEVYRVAGIGEDVTQRRQAEEKVREYYERVQALSRQLLTVQEEQRRRLARELHDEIGQILTSLRFALEASASGPPEAAAGKVGEARALIGEALTRVRELSFDLRPALLDHLGLLPALRGLIERYTACTGVRVNFNQTALDRRFAPELETAAYRIVQEALTNVARHARVCEAEVRLWVDVGTLQVQVEDQGVGFDPETVLAAGRSSGLPGMHERVKLLGGRLAVESAPAGGTHLLAELPLGGPGGEGGR
jgi:PAS domain S-box-containing protein